MRRDSKNDRSSKIGARCAAYRADPRWIAERLFWVQPARPTPASETTAPRRRGPLPRTDNLDVNQIIRALQHDKKSVDGQINWVLLEGVGLPKIVNGGLISARVLRLSLRAGLQHGAKQKGSAH